MRLAAFAVTATCLALGSHLFAGEAPPAAVPTVLAGLLPAAAGILLTRQPRALLEILLVLAAVQVAMHEVFAATATAAGMLFAVCQADANTAFVPVQRRLAAKDALNRWIQHTGSAVFALPPGCVQGDHLGRALLEP